MAIYIGNMAIYIGNIYIQLAQKRIVFQQIKTLFRPNAFRRLPSSGVFTLGSLIN